MNFDLDIWHVGTSRSYSKAKVGQSLAWLKENKSAATAKVAARGWKADLKGKLNK